MSEKLKILGIHDNHNSAACLLEDGSITFATQEERINREKNTCRFPYGAIKAALSYRSLSIDDIDLVVFGGKHNPEPANKEKLIKDYGSASNPLRYYLYAFAKGTPLFRLYSSISRKKRMKFIKELGIPAKKVRFVDHHMSHAASAYYGSHYMDDEEVLILTLDGGGDGLCATVNIGVNGKLSRISSTPEGYSIGNLYAMTTFYLGFIPLEHEYKLMGLAPYSDPRYASEIERKLMNLIDVRGSEFRYRHSKNTLYSLGTLSKIYDMQRFDNIAGAIQKTTEDIVLKWVRNVINKTGIRKLALGGGVFMNVKVNQKIIELDEVEDLFIFPSCGDESTCIGAAYQAYAKYCIEHDKKAKIESPKNMYLGMEFKNEVVEQVLKESNLEYTLCKDVEEEISELLAENKIVARFKGRTEWGARALGNRSILANASDHLITRELNRTIKRRDFWMPFAPSILKEGEQEYIVNPKGIKSPYMTMAFKTTEKMGEIIAALHPFDNTARPQIVHKEECGSFHKLLSNYFDLTGFYGLLNTSFNLHGEPIVNSPHDAVETFLNSGLKYLALGDYLVTK